MDNSIPSSTSGSNATNFYSETSNKFDKKKAMRAIFIKKYLNGKAIIGFFVLFLLIIGGVSAFILSQTSQDVRQQASGCTYWDGSAAAEGSHDNRGGIRQQCKGGVWDVPDDGNLDPSELIAEKEATRPKRGCQTFDGSSVSHGSTDNRGGIRQQCKDGLWDVPDDGITDPTMVGAIELVETIDGMNDGTLNYQESVSVYNQHCREEVAKGAQEFCESLDKLLKEEANNIRYSALNEAVKGNTDSVEQAIAGLDDRSMNQSEARAVYREYCEGSKSQQTSVSACQTLRTEIDEITAIRDAANTVRYTALTEQVTENTDAVAYAIGGLDDRSMNQSEARGVYDEYCTGANAQKTSVSTCQALRDSIDEITAIRDAANTVRYTALTEQVTENTDAVKLAIGGLDNRSINQSEARGVYNEYCTGANAQRTSTSECQNLQDSIDEITTIRDEASEVRFTSLNEEVANNDNQVEYAKNALSEGIMDHESAQITYDEYCVGSNSQRTSVSSCNSLQLTIENTPMVGANAYSTWQAYSNLVSENNSSVENTITQLENKEIEIETALRIEEEICEGRSQSVTNDLCADLTESINEAFNNRRWELYQAKIHGNIDQINLDLDNLETGEVSIDDTEQLYLSSCIGARSVHTPASTCREYRERLDNADIFISNFLSERNSSDEYLGSLDRPEYNEEIIGLADGEYSSANIDFIDYEYIDLRSDVTEIVENNALTMSEWGIETIYCNANDSCTYYKDGEIEVVTFTELSRNIEDYNLDEDSFSILRRDGVFVSETSDGQFIRESNNELYPVEINVCVVDCEWIIPSEQNLRGLAYTVITNADNLSDLVPDMDGDGYILDSDLDSYLNNAQSEDLIDIIISQDKNWNIKIKEHLLENFGGPTSDLLATPENDYVTDIEFFSLSRLIDNRYGKAFDAYGINIDKQSFWELEDSMANVNRYLAFNSFNSVLSSVPILGDYINLPTQDIIDCDDDPTSFGPGDNICFLQRSVINYNDEMVSLAERADTWQERTGTSFMYAGDIDLGTMMVLDYAVDLFPESYWQDLEAIVVTPDGIQSDGYDNTGSSGYTYRTGSFQMDQCNAGCVNYGSEFWWRLSVLAHETAHNQQDIVIPQGNYCIEVGDCVNVSDDVTGRDLLDEYLSSVGIEVNPDQSLEISGSPSIAYYSQDAYAYTNAKEFYAEVLSDAIIDPEGFAQADPELYKLAVVINGFETETYVNDDGIEMIRRKSQ